MQTIRLRNESDCISGFSEVQFIVLRDTLLRMGLYMERSRLRARVLNRGEFNHQRLYHMERQVDYTVATGLAGEGLIIDTRLGQGLRAKLIALPFGDSQFHSITDRVHKTQRDNMYAIATGTISIEIGDDRIFLIVFTFIVIQIAFATLYVFSRGIYSGTRHMDIDMLGTITQSHTGCQREMIIRFLIRQFE